MLRFGINNIIQGENSGKKEHKKRIKNLLEKDFSKIDAIDLNIEKLNLSDFFINQCNRLNQFYSLLKTLTNYYSKNKYSIRNQELDKVSTVAENIFNPERLVEQLNIIEKNFDDPAYMEFLSGDERKRKFNRGDVFNIVKELKNIAQFLCSPDIQPVQNEKEIEENPRKSPNILYINEIRLDQEKNQIEQFQQQSPNIYHNGYKSIFTKNPSRYNHNEALDFDMVKQKIESKFSKLKQEISPTVNIGKYSRRIVSLNSISNIISDTPNKKPSELLEQLKKYRNQMSKQHPSEKWEQEIMFFLELSIISLENWPNENIERPMSNRYKKSA